MPAVRELAPAEYPQWHRILAEAPEGNACQRADWLGLLHDTNPEEKFVILGCFDEQDLLQGGWAVAYGSRWGLNTTGRAEFFYSNPVLAVGAQPGRDHQTARRWTIVTALAEAMAARIPYIEVDCHPQFTDIRCLQYGGWEIKPVYTHTWDMSDPERTWQEMSHEKRRQIRRAQEHYSFGAAEDLETVRFFIQRYHETMAKFGWWISPVWESAFIARFRWMRSQDACRLYTARAKDGSLAAGVIVLLSREDQTAYLWRQGSGAEHVAAGVVPALYWQAASDLAGEFTTVNFGGSPQASLSRFKDYLGARAVLHFQMIRNSRPRRMAAQLRALRLKDQIYNVGMRLARRPIQRMLYALRKRGERSASD
jgi:hypothetical protein